MSKHHAARSRPSVELLEDRLVPAVSSLIMDFTPDSHAGSFADTFSQVRLPGGVYAPAFLDYNGDRIVNNNDVNQFANAITYRVQTLFAGFLGQNVAVRYGDVLTNTNLGTQWLNYGLSSGDIQVAVMSVGGTNRAGPGVLGLAPLASNGYNVEHFGETYTRTLAQWLMNSNPYATPTDFVNAVAQTAAHELGHMLGLRHSAAYNESNLMNAALSPSALGRASFLNATITTQGGSLQNAVGELRASFAGQAQQRFVGSLGGQRLEAEHGHDHDEEECAHGLVVGKMMQDVGASEAAFAGARPVFKPIHRREAAGAVAAPPEPWDSSEDVGVLAAARTQGDFQRLAALDAYFAGPQSEAALTTTALLAVTPTQPSSQSSTHVLTHSCTWDSTQSEKDTVTDPLAQLEQLFPVTGLQGDATPRK